MKTRLTLILVLLIYIGAASHTHAQQKKVIKTMMIAGQDGSHYWQGACEAMKQILENSGMFKVDFAFTPDFGGDIATFKPDFHQYDLSSSTTAELHGQSPYARISRNTLPMEAVW